MFLKGETGEDAPSNVEFMHWMCVTPRARVMLRKNPERMIFDEDLTEEEKAAVLSDIAKARNKRAFSDLEGLTEEEAKKRDKEAADRRAEKRHVRDRLYGKELKDIRRLNLRRKKWEKHQKKIGGKATCQDDYNGIAQ